MIPDVILRQTRAEANFNQGIVGNTVKVSAGPKRNAIPATVPALLRSSIMPSWLADWGNRFAVKKDVCPIEGTVICDEANCSPL